MILKTIRTLFLGLLVTSSGLAQKQDPPIEEHPFSQSEATPDATADTTDPGVQADKLEGELISINWLEEMGKGGATMIALGLLSIVGLAIAVERAIRMREKYIAPLALIKKVEAMEGDVDSQYLEKICAAHPSTLARMLKFVYRHREEPYEMVTMASSDMAGREIRGQMGSIQLLGAVAGLAPLLGLLGTMIGMIESFKLVSIYGDTTLNIASTATHHLWNRESTPWSLFSTFAVDSSPDLRPNLRSSNRQSKLHRPSLAFVVLLAGRITRWTISIWRQRSDAVAPIVFM